MMGRSIFGSLRLAAVAWASVSALSATLVAAQIVRVTPLARDGHILVSFELADAFTDEVRAAISSGLPTTFTYDVELRRSSWWWWDKTMAAARVSASVRYDNLTRRYQVSWMHDGRVQESKMEESEEVVRGLMTRFSQLPLFSTAPLEPNGEYYVRVRVRTRPRNAWFVWPWDRAAASGSAKFTFIP